VRRLVLVLLAFVLAGCHSAEAASARRVFLPVGDRSIPVVRTATRTPVPTATRTRTRVPTPPRTHTATVAPGAPTATQPASTPTPTATVGAFSTALPALADPVDRFSRPDDTQLGYAENGALWITDGSSWAICAQQACASAAKDGGNWARIYSGWLDQYAEVKIRPRDLEASGSAGVGLRASADWRQMLYVGLDARGLIEVWTLVDGVWSDGPIVAIATAFNGRATRTLEVSVLEAALDVRVDSALVLWQEWVPDAPPDGSWVTIFASTADEDARRWPRLDDFRSGAPRQARIVSR
jgi:hypothetical protein